MLIILAGVSIATLTGENGIITKANDAKTDTAKAGAKEKVQMAVAASYGTNGTIDYTELKNNLNKIEGITGVPDTITEASFPLTVQVDGYDVTIDDTWKVTVEGEVAESPEEPEEDIEEPGDLPAGWDGTKVDAVQSADTVSVTVPVPKGFVASNIEGEKTVAGGFVIYEGEVSETANQFVWIPATVSEMANKISGTDANGNQNYQGKLYDFTATSATEMTNYGQGTSSYREPDTVSTYDNNYDNYLSIIVGILGNESKYNTETAFKQTMQEDYNEMIKSVAKYGGFYVGRYEMSKSSSNTVQSKANSIALTASSANTWYGLYAYGKTYNTDSVASSMIWGSQYDAMIRWMQKNGVNVTTTNDDIKSTNETTTGYIGDKDILKNVYDLYGGRREWSLEAYSSNFRVYRGGCYDGSYSPSNLNGYRPNYADSGYSSRATLYIK